MFKEMRIPYNERPILAFGMLAGAITLAFLTKTYGPILFWLSAPAALTALAAWYYSKRESKNGKEINNDPSEMLLGQVFQYIWSIGLAVFGIVVVVEILKFLFLG